MTVGWGPPPLLVATEREGKERKTQRSSQWSVPSLSPSAGVGALNLNCLASAGRLRFRSKHFAKFNMYRLPSYPPRKVLRGSHSALSPAGGEAA